MRWPRRVRVEARAKLNLGLAVGPRRRDGFHELATVFQSISLADTLVAEHRPRGFELVVRHRGRAARPGPAGPGRGVPAGPGNLVLRAARLVARRTALPGGARFVLVKRIPARAGLGGGSADAAAALAALCALYGVRAPRSERLEWAAELGSDVPFASTGGTALGLGRGERLTRLALARPFRAVVAVPGWRISTANAYARIDHSKYGLTLWPSKLRFGKSLRRMALEPLAALRLGNTFEGALGGRRLAFADLRSRLREAGLMEPRLSGSGSSVFGLLEPRVTAPGVLARFRGAETLYVVRSAGAGLHIRKVW